jgi:hypothetical protein
LPGVTLQLRLEREVFGDGAAEIVADVVLIAAKRPVAPVPTACHTSPHTSQSPAVSEIEVTLAGVLLVKVIPGVVTVEEMNSPTAPAAALLLVVVPTMPAV